VSETDAAVPGRTGVRAAASDRLLAGVLREESGRIVAALTGWLGSLDLARNRSPRRSRKRCGIGATRGVPPNPGGWLTQAARHNAARPDAP
jgi:RNA polymerase sigma-70 factor (ECF subfamily)